MITKTHNTLEYLAAENIAAPHGFTTRLGGVSTGFRSSLNLAVSQGESLENVEKNLHILANALGFDSEKLVLTRQIHSDMVRVVTEADCQGLCHRNYPACDGLVTATPGVALLIFTADCTPLLFHDPVTGAVGAAHAGWRGTAQNIGGKTVEAMVRAFGCKPENIRCAIGPNIGPCHFETNGDVPQALVDCYGREAADYIRREREKYYPDLKAINALALRRAGVRSIDISGDCTYCQHERFWSHRYTGGQRGSQGAVILCTGPGSGNNSHEVTR